MATQAVQNQAIGVVSGEQSNRWERVRDVFGGIADYLSLFFNKGARIEVLDPIHRAGFSVAERNDIDIDLLGIRRQ